MVKWVGMTAVVVTHAMCVIITHGATVVTVVTTVGIDTNRVGLHSGLSERGAYFFCKVSRLCAT